MSKLPAEFVKSPAKQAKPRPQRTRKASLISPDPVRDPHELLLQLTDDELRALENAGRELQRTDSEITLEQMLHRVLADWMLRLNAPPRAAEAARAAPAEPELLTRLRTFIASPLRIWHELAGRVRRTIG